MYETTFGIPTSGITTAFGCYILAVLVALAIFGRVSDHLGRRPVSLAAIAAAIAGCILLEFVDSTPSLIAARTVQGVAVGLGTSSISTFGFELGSPRRPWLAPAVFSAGASMGVAVGALVSGYFVQYVGHPRRTIFDLMIGLLLVAAVGILLTPETRERQPGARRSLQPRMGIPRRLRRAFVLSCVAFIASWSMGGLYQSLAPTINAQIFGLDNHFLGGLIVSMLVGTSALTSLAVARLGVRRNYVGGSIVLAVGALLTAGGVQWHDPVLFYASSVVAGIGWGASFLGAFTKLTSAATQQERAGLLSAVYLVIYFGSATPAVVAGSLAADLGLSRVVLTYAIAVAALSVIAAASYFLDPATNAEGA